jgi:hypothetical protein
MMDFFSLVAILTLATLPALAWSTALRAATEWTTTFAATRLTTFTLMR